MTQETFTMKEFDDLTYADSFLFGEVMLDETTSKNVLEIILGVEIERVVIIEKEKQIDYLPDSKSIRMDIYVRDKEETVYNIEMQVRNKKDIPKRSRYYQGLLDEKLLPSGAKNYNQLNTSYIIFICQFDPFGFGRCCYTFEERCLEDLTFPLGDGARKIFLNTSGKNQAEISEDLREFLDYVKDPTSAELKSEKVKAIDNRVSKVKLDMEVRSKYMTLEEWIDDQCSLISERAREQGKRKGLEEGRAEGLEEGREEGRAEGKIESKVEQIRVKYKKKYGVEKTAEMLELDVAFVEEIYQLFQSYPEENDKQITMRYLR